MPDNDRNITVECRCGQPGCCGGWREVADLRAVVDDWIDTAGRYANIIERLKAERDELLDALEGMAHQYATGPTGHAFMGAGEQATEVLARRYPGRWRDNGRGLDWIGGDDA